MSPELTVPSVRLILGIHYPPSYPDVMPNLKLTTTEGNLSEAEEQSLLADLHSVVRALDPST